MHLKSSRFLLRKVGVDLGEKHGDFRRVQGWLWWEWNWIWAKRWDTTRGGSLIWFLFYFLNLIKMVYAIVIRVQLFWFNKTLVYCEGQFGWKVGLVSGESGLVLDPKKKYGRFGASVGMLLGAICGGEIVNAWPMIWVSMDEWPQNFVSCSYDVQLCFCFLQCSNQSTKPNMHTMAYC